MRIAPLAALACLVVGSVERLQAQSTPAAVTLVNDQFTDGERSAQNLPGSAAWYVDGASSMLSVQNGQLDLNVTNAERNIWLYFPATTLAVGQTMTVTVDFSVTTASANGVGSLRLGVLNSNGVPHLTADGAAPTGNYNGYAAFAAGLSPQLILEKRGGPGASSSNSPLLDSVAVGSSVIWGGMNSSPANSVAVFQRNSPYVATIELIRSGTDAMIIESSITGEGLSAASVGVQDISGTFSTFDTLALNLSNFFVGGDLLISKANVSVEGLPAFTAVPSSQTIAPNTTVVFDGAAVGATSYQWLLNGKPLANATSARLVIFGATAGNAGTYNLVATNAGGSIETNPATLTVANTSDVGRLANLSVLNVAGSATVLTVGFFSGGGAPNSTQTVLARASGPALAGFGLSGTLPDPTLRMFNGAQTVVAANDNWAVPTTNDSSVVAAENAVGAFALDPASFDAATVAALSPGGYSVQISGNGADSGTVLAEVYDTTPSSAYEPATSSRLTNLSTLTQVSGSGTLAAGFVIGGSTAKTVLIRATGPALANLGLNGTLGDPALALYATSNGSDTEIAFDAGWGGDPQITAVGNAVHAFALTDPGSADSVIVLTLPPGNYSAVSGSRSGAGTGTVLVEVYEVP